MENNNKNVNTPVQTANVDETGTDKPFWQVKSLSEMTTSEWESLCDGCARCCLNKLEDWDTGEIVWTNIACSLLDDHSCRCKNYENRLETIPDCVPLTPQTVEEISWLPATCAYRLLDEGYDLYWWHPLVSGDPDTVHQAGISVRGRVISEEGMTVEDYENHLVHWPGKTPKMIPCPFRSAELYRHKRLIYIVNINFR
ncbi:YcgN family cysteine cluster protein [uncultured Cohaesibacter sp.]|uniref:YcgN family cysteine cluster protein n=1 Tax=uncultured Cohaesibacter sp. TaxID=1002546 RepID=UPI00292F91BF|nr:YcgN family cysteine cluster protein [uncultured Cohaesibacter sp.]